MSLNLGLEARDRTKSNLKFTKYNLRMCFKCSYTYMVMAFGHSVQKWPLTASEGFKKEQQWCSPSMSRKVFGHSWSTPSVSKSNRLHIVIFWFFFNFFFRNNNL